MRSIANLRESCWGLLALCAMVASSAPARTATVASFNPLGVLPGGYSWSQALAVSRDGTTVVGSSAGAGMNSQAFRWTTSGGMVGLGFLPGGTSSLASGVSADGSVIVGDAFDSASVHAMRWTSGEGMESLGSPALINLAMGVSADGTVVAGYVSNIFSSSPFRWTGEDGLVTLPASNSRAYGISDDGLVIVGIQGAQAMRWMALGGIVGMGDLPGGSTSSEAFAASADGSVIVGRGTSAAGQEAFRWTAGGGMVGLGDLPGEWFGSSALAVSADGSVVVGRGTSASGTSSPFLWTEASGMQSIEDILIAQGLGSSIAG